MGGIMKKDYWALLVLVIVLGGMSFASGELKSEYPVSQVLKVRSVSQFDCKIDGYPYDVSAPFHVQIRDVKADPQVPVEEAAEYIYERLKNAEHVMLCNIQFRNYFRLTADVVVDGRDLKQELVTMGLARSPELVDVTSGTSQKGPARPSVRRYQPAVYAPRSRVERHVITLQSLMDTQVDFSLVNEETPLAEALQILSESVRPYLPLIILWNDLENNALVSRDMPIGVGGEGKITVKRALELVLHSVSQRAATKLLLSVSGGVMTVGTQKGLLVKSTVHSYPVEDIIAVPSYGDTDEQTRN